MKWFVFESNAPKRSSFFILELAIGAFLGACQSSDVTRPNSNQLPNTQESARTAEDAQPPPLHDFDASHDGSVTAALLVDAAAPLDAGEDAAIDAGDDASIDGGMITPPCPLEMTHIGRYCVDRWEGHLVTTNADGTTSPWPHFDRPEKGTKYLARSAAGVFPQAYISRVEAQQACSNAGKRLCSRAEWMRACKGSKGTRYPYGNKGKRGACNTGKTHLLHTFFGAKRGGWTYENFNDPKLNQEPGFLAKSGEYGECHSDEEVFDIVGNLHEWIADNVRSDIKEVLEKDGVERKEQPWRIGNGMFMGGFFSTTIEHGPGCTYTTIAHEPKYHDYSTGFRCCKTAVLPDKPTKDKDKKRKKR